MTQNLIKSVTVCLFRVASRMLKESEGEKCPKCNQTWTDFMIVTEHLWGCYVCGTVFVPKKVRTIEVAGKKAQILLQHKEIKAEKIVQEAKELRKTLTCPELDCGFQAKNEQGLKIHMKKHKK